MSLLSDQLALILTGINNGTINAQNCESHQISKLEYPHFLAVASIGAPVLAAGTAVVGLVGIDQTTPGTTNLVQAQDAGPSWTTSRGIAGARFTSADQSAAVASVTDAPTSGKKLVITDLLISSDTALRLDFSIESSVTVIETVYMAANETKQITVRGKWKLATADKKLQVQSSIAGNLSITPFYFSEA
jgi:hypothetical protein